MSSSKGKEDTKGKDLTLIEKEVTRYYRKGTGLLGAFLINLVVFYSVPRLLKPYYEMLPLDNLYISFVLVSMSLNLGTTIGLGTILYFVYTLKFNLIEKYRVSQDPWPWEKNPAEYRKLLKETMKILFINEIIVSFLTICLPVKFNFLSYNFDPLDFPSSTEIVVQLIFMMIVEDTGFYWTHRLLHTPWLYKNVHKKHHEYTTTIGIAFGYSHPFDYFFSGIVPYSLGPVLLGKRCHIFTGFVWGVFRRFETFDGHCGYEFPWSPFRLLPFSGSSEYHNFHHSHNLGNFSSFFTYWDTICQTNQHYWKFLSKSYKTS